MAISFVRSEVFRVGVSIACLFAIFYYFPISSLYEAVQSVEPRNFVLAFAFVLVGTVLTSLRFYGMSRKFQLDISFRVAHHLNILSQIAGLFLFQTFGQTIFRSAYGLLYVPKAQRFALLTFIEKITAFTILILLATIGAFTIYQQIGVPYDTLGYISLLAFCIGASGIAIWHFGLSYSQRRYLRFGLKQTFRLGIGRAAGLSLVTHLFTLGAYLAIVHPMIPDMEIGLLSGIFLLVMLGAAIPISFAGWGIREMSAGLVFGFLSLDPLIGVSASAAVGVLSLIALLLQGGLTLLFQPEKTIADQERPLGGKFKFERILAFVCSILICLLIGFQVKFPTENGGFTANLADPLTVVAAITFLIFIFRSNLSRNVWKVEGFHWAILAFSAMIGIGWLNSFLTTGTSSWADHNRGIGLIIIFSYLLAGTMFTCFFGLRYKNNVAQIIFITSVVLFFAFIFLAPYLGQFAGINLGWRRGHFLGLVGNRNAMAFLLMVVMILFLSRVDSIKSSRFSISMGVLSFLIVQTGSLTGMIAIMFALILALFGGLLKLKEAGYLVVTLGGLMTLQYLLNLYPTGSFFVSQDSFKISDSTIFSITDSSKTGIPMEFRLKTMIHGWQMWIANPLLGDGLGQFLAKSKESLGTVVAIHNSILWILAEMGLLGLVLFAVMPFLILKSIYTGDFSKDKQERWVLLIFLLSVGLFSMAHEVLYQRILWFALGLLIAKPLSRPIFSGRKVV